MSESFRKFIKEEEEKLNPEIWTEEKELRPEVKEKLLAIANRYVEFLKIDAKPVDIIFTGSMANYNWNTKSDIDLHVVFDYSEIDENNEIVKELMMAKKGIWNDRHNITIYGYPVELYSQDSNEPHYSNGIYSIMKDEWEIKPEIKTNKVDKQEVERKAQPYRDDIDKAIEAEDLEKLEKITERLKDYRQAGLKKNGEYSIENLVFKTLRNDGTIEKLSDAKLELFDRMLTLKDSIDEEGYIRKRKYQEEKELLMQ